MSLVPVKPNRNENLLNGLGPTSHGSSQIAVRSLHKFGGSSLASPMHFLRVVEILKDHAGQHDLVVVSAAGKTTNLLIEWFDGARGEYRAGRSVAYQVHVFQMELIQTLLDGKDRARLIALFEQDFLRIQQLFGDPNARQEVLGFGELWSARLLQALLQQNGTDATLVDSRTVLRAEHGPQPSVDFEASQPLVDSVLDRPANGLLIFTGYMAANKIGQTVLLGRNGSDYSATALGRLARTDEVTIWSDVAGIYTADPKCIPSAKLLSTISIDESNELARLGAGVLHPRALQPAYGSTMNVCLRSSIRPTAGETRVTRDVAEEGMVKTITAIDRVCVVKISGVSTQDVRSIETRLAASGISSLATITTTSETVMAIPEAAVPSMRQTLVCFEQHTVTYETGFSAVALVGGGVNSASLAGTVMLEVLDQELIEWTSENGLSVVAVLRGDQSSNALEQLHAKLFDWKTTVAK